MRTGRAGDLDGYARFNGDRGGYGANILFFWSFYGAFVSVKRLELLLSNHETVDAQGQVRLAVRPNRSFLCPF